MEMMSAASKDLTKLKGGKLALILKANADTEASCLEKDYQVTSVAFERTLSTADWKVDVAVPIFWLEPQRENGADMYWSKLTNSIKFKVSDGEFKGFVGYLKTSPPMFGKEIHLFGKEIH